MTTVIVVTVLVLLGLGIVINELLRLRRYLKNTALPPEPPAPPEPPSFDPPI
ncbi:hypothetical protein [Mycobacterium kubicae]|uniref:Signal recognition particle-docking protein FtsY n=1 Tax=Mycobacterium kubicae TaxID=120959 RepID=A0AAX1JBR5_9MYCO|nr:hypothetical protein [Mycobacterium kubicae]MCV7095207.1 hypothetical protein [Mycobacterium kubicae]QPI37808.1 hypothetical protein I2456_26770 [Mycobacterium kubicae]